MNTQIGKYVLQDEGYKSFIPFDFPFKDALNFSKEILEKSNEAHFLVGKLDGIIHVLPELSSFLLMFMAKDAESSSQIEGTRATVVDFMKTNIGVNEKDTDSDDILYYIKALQYGLKRISDLPLSMRLLREVHKELMTGARASYFSNPGEFRKTQNWIGGKNISEASYVPPTVLEMTRSLSDLEKFFYDDAFTYPLIQIALIHSQFETIHPFLDGNGRCGRLLITLLLKDKGLLQSPVLFLSSYFKKHQVEYYQKLNNYHKGEIDEWVNFFLDGVIDISKKSINLLKKVSDLYKKDMEKISMLSKREHDSTMLVLDKLYSQPIISTKVVME
ncbi:MAG: Fic family protein [Candidatus Pacebacteria bacterium]|nr:Fic family protein [Candidatus Paceibacterota bacterium]